MVGYLQMQKQLDCLDRQILGNGNGTRHNIKLYHDLISMETQSFEPLRVCRRPTQLRGSRLTSGSPGVIPRRLKMKCRSGCIFCTFIPFFECQTLRNTEVQNYKVPQEEGSR
nr:unnamed protein product [Spirometra erinaceieuropaei]